MLTEKFLHVSVGVIFLYILKVIEEKNEYYSRKEIYMRLIILA